MTAVVALVGLPGTTPVRSAVRTLTEAGADVTLVSFGDVPGLAADVVRHVTLDRPPRRELPRPLAVLRAVAELVLARRPTDRFRKAAMAHPEVPGLAADATVVVALDTPAVDVAWHLCRADARVEAVVGLAAARRVLTDR